MRIHAMLQTQIRKDYDHMESWIQIRIPSFWELYPDPHQGAKPDLPQSAMSDPDPHQSEKLKAHLGAVEPWRVCSLVLQIRISLMKDTETDQY
jgi:hypothetical protein